jgi:hypothetical protein
MSNDPSLDTQYSGPHTSMVDNGGFYWTDPIQPPFSNSTSFMPLSYFLPDDFIISHERFQDPGFCPGPGYVVDDGNGGEDYPTVIPLEHFQSPDGFYATPQ